jgi:hypothetical protein
MKRPPFWVFSLAFFPLGLGGVALSLSSLFHAHHSSTWPSVPGIVLSSEISTRLVGASQPEVRYSYAINGAPYVSNRIWPGDVVSSMPVVHPGSAKDIVARFHSGQTIPVFVNPQDATDAALWPGPSKVYEWLLVFLFFLAIGQWMPLGLERITPLRRLLSR